MTTLNSSSNIAYPQCRLIVAQMSNTRCEGFNFLTLLLLGAMLVSFYMPILERFLVYLLLLLSTLLHWHYGTIVVQQMCKHFDRICFKVTKPRQRKVE
jgi:ethanolaminephosphotransferase